MYLDLDPPERNYRKPSVAQGQILLEISELRHFLHRQTCMRDLDLQQWVRVCRRNLKKQPPASLLLSSSLSQIRPELVYASPANQETKGKTHKDVCQSVSQSVLIAISYSSSTMAVFSAQTPAGTGHDFATV